MTQLLVFLPPALTIGAGVLVTAHILLHKHHTRAAVGWIALVWMVPIVGMLLYWILGINRVHRRVQLLGLPPYDGTDDVQVVSGPYAGLSRAVGDITQARLVDGNTAELLDGAEVVLPQMVAAIDNATRSVALAVYIFDTGPAGTLVAEALGRAHARGVSVRVLIDALGNRLSRRGTCRLLTSLDVPYTLFLPAMPWNVAFLNLRNHRKLLVVDGNVGFTGGMNIREGTRDLMVRVEGPVAAALLDVFRRDWTWCTSESLNGPAWHPISVAKGACKARVIPDGPDRDWDCARMTFISGLAAAKHTVRIVTPYFLPDEMLISALHAAALRGVEVDVLLPSHSNLPYLAWATHAELPNVLAHGCRVWAVPPPFDHSKLMVVDDAWVLVGSANWDERSLRLDFELLLEVYDTDLAATANTMALDRRDRAHRITLDELAAAPMLARLRNAALRLFKPYL